MPSMKEPIVRVADREGRLEVAPARSEWRADAGSAATDHPTGIKYTNVGIRA